MFCFHNKIKRFNPGRFSQVTCWVSKCSLIRILASALVQPAVALINEHNAFSTMICDFCLLDLSIELDIIHIICHYFADTVTASSLGFEGKSALIHRMIHIYLFMFLPNTDLCLWLLHQAAPSEEMDCYYPSQRDFL